jgi:hypothetical protein
MNHDQFSQPFLDTTSLSVGFGLYDRSSSQKTYADSDALDAQAICEAVQRPTMRFVPVKTLGQTICRLARLDASTAFNRGQDTARRHLQARRPIPAQVARRRRYTRHSPHERQANPHGQLDHEALGEEAVQGRLGRACQQTGAYCVGRLDAKESVPALSTSGLRKAQANRIGNGSR